MSYLKFTLALVSIICATDSVRAWNLGVVTPTQIKFFSNGTVDTEIDVQLKHMYAAAFDPIKKYVYVSDPYEKIASIFRIKTSGNTAYNVAEPIVAKRTQTVNGIAFNHLKSTLYWTTYDTIFYVHVPDNEITVPLTGQVLIKFDQELPLGIAIDVRRGYLYWTNTYHLNATVERSRLDGSGRQVLVYGNYYIPLAVAVDVESNTLYWGDEHEDLYYSIRSMDLRYDSTKHTLVQGAHHHPNAIALDDRHVYWSDWTSNAVWTVPKNSSRHDVSPTMVNLETFELIDTPLGLFSTSGGDCENNVDASVPSAGSKDMSLDLKFLTALVSIIITINYLKL